MTPRYNRARLISSDDRLYRQFLERIMVTKDNQRATRPPSARDLFGGEAEAALRGWLGQSLQLSERRIVEYEERRGRSWGRKYRELDAVWLELRSVHVFEIKASRSAGALLRGMQQLQETRQILGLLFPRVATTLLFVDTGVPTPVEVAQLMAGPEPPARPPLTLDDVLRDNPGLQLASSLETLSTEPGVVSLLRFSIDDIIALAGAENLHLNWEEGEPGAGAGEQGAPEQSAEAPAGEAPADEQDATADGEENPLAFLLRKALRERDEQE